MYDVRIDVRIGTRFTRPNTRGVEEKSDLVTSDCSRPGTEC